MHRTISKLLAVVVTATAATLAAAPAASAAIPDAVRISAEAPYVHSRPFAPDEVYAAGAGFPGATRVLLHQFYGGQWHTVAFHDSDGPNGHRTTTSVVCSGDRTPYRFRTLTRLTTSAGTFSRFSREVTLKC